MQDRIPENPGRVLITPEGGGAPYHAVIAMADNPTEPGTPLSKANLLKDATAARLGLPDTAVPDDALNELITRDVIVSPSQPVAWQTWLQPIQRYLVDAADAVHVELTDPDPALPFAFRFDDGTVQSVAKSDQFAIQTVGIGNDSISAVLQTRIEGILTDIMVRTNAQNVLLDDGRTLAAVLADYITAEQIGAQIDERINALIGGAPAAFDTLREVADYIAANSNITDALTAAISGKVDKIPGMGLSTEDFTSAHKTKLENLTADMIDETAERQFVTADTLSDIAAAQTAADKGIADAAVAQTAAQNAQQTADQAITNAQGAQTTADKGVSDAATAKTAADNAKTAAQAAQTTASQAITNAAAAKTAADNAQTTANKGVSDAAAAKTAADNAKAVADTKEPLIKDAAAKTTLVDADTIPLSDSAASNATRKITWANFKAVLKTYFDTLYNKVIVNNTLTSDSSTEALSAAQGKALKTALDAKPGTGSIPTAYTAAPQMDGAASAGSSAQWSRGDHRHASDTTREPLIKDAAAKTTLVDADTIPLSDSAASSVTKKIAFANIKAVLKAYFDALFVPVTRTINGKALSANITLAKSDVGLGNANDTADNVKIVKGLLQTDSRSLNPAPFDNGAFPVAGIYADFKSNASDGLADGGSYHRVMTYRPWSDSSGGKATQLAFTDNGNVWVRASNSAGTGWDGWSKIFSSNNLLAATTTTTGLMSAADKTKLGSVGRILAAAAAPADFAAGDMFLQTSNRTIAS